MMTLLRRFLVLAALMFWQGGFTFYAAVVVPVGQHLLGHLDQGFITRLVTNYLNLAGAVALLPLAWDAAAFRAGSSWRYWARWCAWCGMAITLGLLVWQHAALDQLLDPEANRVLDRSSFRPAHRAYLWTSTIQWALAVVYAGLSLWAWRAEDHSGKGLPRVSGASQITSRPTM